MRHSEITQIGGVGRHSATSAIRLKGKSHGQGSFKVIREARLASLKYRSRYPPLVSRSPPAATNSSRGVPLLTPRLGHLDRHRCEEAILICSPD